MQNTVIASWSSSRLVAVALSLALALPCFALHPSFAHYHTRFIYRKPDILPNFALGSGFKHSLELFVLPLALLLRDSVSLALVFHYRISILKSW